MFVLKSLFQHRSRVVAVGLCAALIAAVAVGGTFLLSRGRRRTVETPVNCSNSRLAERPRLMLWAWERPEDLRFLDPRAVGVAYLAATIRLSRAEAVAKPRLQPLELPPGMIPLAVFRVETDSEERPELSDAQRDRLVERILSTIRSRPVSGVQIDFDAKRSERAFYRNFLGELRGRLPAETPLSMTALASWCVFDTWIEGLPVDEVVPMVFQMGADEKRISDFLESGNEFRPASCRCAMGLAVDELPKFVPRSDRRLYLFNSSGWSRGAVEAVRRNVSVPPAVAGGFF